MMTYATQSGVLNAETEVKAEPQPTARELAMEAISANNNASREAEHVEQTGKSLFNAQIDAQLEETPLDKKPDPVAGIDASLVTVKIDGEERQVTVAEMKRQYQKNGAAEKRLEEATRLLTEARQRAEVPPLEFDQTQKKSNTEGSELPSVGGDQAKELVAALFEGDEEKAVAAMSRIVGGRSDPTLDINQLTAQLAPAIKQQLIVESALEEFGKAYADIVADPYLASMADGFLAEAQKDPEKSFAESLETAGQKTRDWLKSKGVVTTQPNPTIDRNEKLARKESMDRIPALQTRATTTEPVEESRSDVILQMQRARGLAV
jgi:hypothetical protein